MLSGSEERQLEVGLREAFADPLLGADAVPEAEVGELAAGSPNAARAMLALYRAWRVAREDAGGIALPSGRRILLPNEEARDLFDERANIFPNWRRPPRRSPPRWRRRAGRDEPRHRPAAARAAGLAVTVRPLDGALRRYDPAGRAPGAVRDRCRARAAAFTWRSSSPCWRRAMRCEAVLAAAAPRSPEAGMLIRIGLLNYVGGALVMPYAPFLAAARELRHDMEAVAARFGVSFEQACHRLSTMQRPGRARRAVLLPAGRSGGQRVQAVLGGRVSRSPASAAPARAGWCIPPSPARAACRCRSPSCRTAPPSSASPAPCSRPAAHWGEPRPVHVVAMGCALAHAGEVVYADGLDLDRARVGIGLSCRLCDRPDCRSRAFPPLEHRLALDPNSTGVTPYRFEARRPTKS